MKLTDRSAAQLTLPAGKRDVIFFDDAVPGFGLRIREGGTRVWIFRYRFGRLQRSIKLGSAASLSVATARTNASKLEAEVRLGGDPAGKKELAKAEAEQTFGSLAQAYLDARRHELRPASMAEYSRHLLIGAKALHRLPVTAVTQADVAKLLNDAPGAATANRLRSTLSAMFTWVLREGVVLPRGNPATYTNKRAEQPRDRVLSDAELKALWAALNNDFGSILKLLILTGARAEEIAALRWSEVTDDSITLPKERTKNRRSHVIPLSDLAREILATARRGNRVHVFGRDDTGFSGFSRSKERLDEKLELAPWRVHDLRRTAATRMADLGVQPHIVEAVLNHVSGHKAGVAGVYNRAAYDKEKREALNLWAEHVAALVEGRKAVVVPMKKGA